MSPAGLAEGGGPGFGHSWRIRLAKPGAEAQLEGVLKPAVPTAPLYPPGLPFKATKCPLVEVGGKTRSK
jgi:hypothetical protein